MVKPMSRSPSMLMLGITSGPTTPKQAEILKVSRGSVCYLPRPVSSADLEIMRPRRVGGADHSIRRVDIQSIRAVAMGSMARLSHHATSSPKLWMSR